MVALQKRRLKEVNPGICLLGAGLLLAALFIPPEIALGGVHIGLGGSAENRNHTQSITDEFSISGSIAFDIGRYVRLGYTYRRDQEVEKGTMNGVNSDSVPWEEEFTFRETMTMQSVDLTLVPLAGKRVMPYIFGGIAHKDYLIERRYQFLNSGTPTEDDEGFTTWNAGIGFQIALSQRLSFKISHAWSPGLVFDEEGELKGDVIDTFLRFGLSYKI